MERRHLFGARVGARVARCADRRAGGREWDGVEGDAVGLWWSPVS